MKLRLTGVELSSSGHGREGDNLYDKEPLALSGSKFSVTIQEHNLRMILLTKKDAAR